MYNHRSVFSEAHREGDADEQNPVPAIHIEGLRAAMRNIGVRTVGPAASTRHTRSRSGLDCPRCCFLLPRRAVAEHNVHDSEQVVPRGDQRDFPAVFVPLHDPIEVGGDRRRQACAVPGGLGDEVPHGGWSLVADVPEAVDRAADILAGRDAEVPPDGPVAAEPPRIVDVRGDRAGGADAHTRDGLEKRHGGMPRRIRGQVLFNAGHLAGELAKLLQRQVAAEAVGICRQVQIVQPRQVVAAPRAFGRHDAMALELRPQAVLASRSLDHQPLTVLDDGTPAADLQQRHMHRGHLVKVQELSELLDINPVVLFLRPEDQPQLPGVRHGDASGELLKQGGFIMDPVALDLIGMPAAFRRVSATRRPSAPRRAIRRQRRRSVSAG